MLAQELEEIRQVLLVLLQACQSPDDAARISALSSLRLQAPRMLQQLPGPLGQDGRPRVLELLRGSEDAADLAGKARVPLHVNQLCREPLGQLLLGPCGTLLHGGARAAPPLKLQVRKLFQQLLPEAIHGDQRLQRTLELRHVAKGRPLEEVRGGLPVLAKELLAQVLLHVMDVRQKGLGLQDREEVKEAEQGTFEVLVRCPVHTPPVNQIPGSCQLRVHGPCQVICAFGGQPVDHDTVCPPTARQPHGLQLVQVAPQEIALISSENICRKDCALLAQPGQDRGVVPLLHLLQHSACLAALLAEVLEKCETSPRDPDPVHRQSGSANRRDCMLRQIFESVL
mmetsp:Transcript_2342/g.7475  ORF Transcript_2342/g.7475 Transcript_2342/m.7475 type:complete len:341 (+) Transcript_2342:1806-2828(+)